MFLITFDTGQAEPLVPTRIQRPRGGRRASANHPRDMNRRRPEARQVREHEQAEDRPQLRFNHVREQSAAASSLCHQAPQQTVRSRDEDASSSGCQATAATDANGPQTGHNPELSTSAASFPSSIGCEPEQPQVRPHRRIAVAVSRPIRFPVHIRNV